MKQRLKYPFVGIGGEDGLKITRAAFAVLLKFADLSEPFNNLIDAMELEEGDVKEALNSLDTGLGEKI
jgi:hypothetical protein